VFDEFTKRQSGAIVTAQGISISDYQQHRPPFLSTA
jgi:hypothetical protein